MKTIIKFKLLFLFSLMTICSLHSQVKVFSTDFSTGIPVAWNQEPATSSLLWSTQNAGIQSVVPDKGNSYVSLFSANPIVTVKLITHFFDLQYLSDPALYYEFIQPSFSNGSVDTLKVYYRNSVNESWTLITKEEGSFSNWSSREIDLNANSDSIQFAFEYNYGNGQGIGIDYLYVGNKKQCSQVSNLSIHRITSNSAHIYWGDQEFANSYNVRISKTSLTNLSQPLSTDSITVEANIELDGLEPNTEYYFYVQSDCGNSDYGNWSEEGRFHTSCSLSTLPFEEDFELVNIGSLPSCWVANMEMGGEWGTGLPSPTYQPVCKSDVAIGSKSFCLSAFYEFNTALNAPKVTKSWLTLPEIMFASVNDIQMSFKINTSNPNLRLFLGLTNNQLDIYSFEEVIEINVYKTNQWEEFVIPFNDVLISDKNFITFWIDGGDHTETTIVYIDDIKVESIQTCPKPSMLRVEKNNSDSIVLNWFSKMSSNWEIWALTEPMTDFTSNSDGFRTTTSSIPCVIRGLSPSTDYYLYIRSLCGDSDYSEWSSPLYITTPCMSINEFPYILNVDTMTLYSMPDCWSRPIEYIFNSWNGSFTYPMIQNYNTSSSTKALLMRSIAKKSAYIVSPPIISDISAMEISFIAKAENNNFKGKLEVGIMSVIDDIKTFIHIQDIYLSATDNIEYTIPLINQTLYGGGNSVAFKYTSDNQNAGCYIANIVIDSISSCPIPDDINTRRLSSSSVVLEWNNNIYNNSWHIKVSSNFINQPSIENTDIYSGVVSADSLVLNNLIMGKDYYVAIQSICSSDTSSWIRYEFTTPCSNISYLPYYETFSDHGIDLGTFPPCWQRSSATYPLIVSLNNTNTVGKASGSLMFYPTTGDMDQTQYITLPMVDVQNVPLKDMQISFVYRSPFINATLILGVVDTIGNMSSFMPLDTFVVTSTNSFISVDEYSFNDYNGTGKYIVFLTKLGINNVNLNIVYLDDILLEEIPLCKKVQEKRIINELSDRATIEWSQEDSITEWDIVYGEVGFNPDTMTTFISTRNSFYTITGLTERTSYDIYIRNNCGIINGYSIWGQPLTITTTPDSENTPIYSDFEDELDNEKWKFINGSQTNKWVIGTDTQKDGLRSIYISDDIINHYDTSEFTYVYAYRTIYFTPGDYRIAFDWKGQGENYFDYGNVYLMNTSSQIVAGQRIMDLGNNLIYNLGKNDLLLSSDWIHVEDYYEINQEKVYNLVLAWTNNSNNNGIQPPFALDNLVVELLECGKAERLKAIANDSSAAISWYSKTGDIQWEVKVSAVPVELNMIDSIETWVYDSVLDVNNFILNDLVPQTDYYVYVRSYCYNGVNQEWSSLLFNTECERVNYLPFYDDFESYGSGPYVMPGCWRVISSANYNNEKYPYVSNVHNYSNMGNASLVMATPMFSQSMNLVVSPMIAIDSLNKLIVDLQMFTINNNVYPELGVMTNPSDISTFHSIAQLQNNNLSTWEKKTISLDNYNGDGKYIAIKLAGNVYSEVYFDDISIQEQRSCDIPMNIVAYNLSTNNATIAWNSSNLLSSYNLKVSTVDINPELEEADIVDVINISDGFYNLSGLLEENTLYYVYIQSSCNENEQSYWSRKFTFNTLCSDINVPYLESFNTIDLSNEILPECWNYYLDINGNVSGDYYSKIFKGISSDQDTFSLLMKSYYENYIIPIYGSMTNSVSSYVILPKFSDNLNDLFLSFNSRGTENDQLKVGYMSDAGNPGSFIAIDTIVLGDWKNSTIFFSDVEFDGHIVFLLDGVTNQSSGIAYLDHIIVESLEDCKPAINIKVENISSNSADISWNNVSINDTIWNFKLLLKNGILYDSILDTIIIGNSLYLNNLISNTNYYYEIRPICDSIFGPKNDLTLSFTTECGLVSLPYVESFDLSFNNMDIPRCWNSYSSYSNDIPKIVDASVYNSSSIGALYLYSSSNTYTYAVLPDLDIDSVKRLNIYFKGYSNQSTGQVQVGVMTDPNDISTFTLCEIVSVTSSSLWTEFTVSIANYLGDGKFIALKSDCRASKINNMFVVDDILVYDSLSCLSPSQLHASQISDSSVLISWDKVSAVENWDIAICSKDYNPNIGSQSIVNSDNNFYLLEGLVQNTIYDIYIRSVCDNDQNGIWKGPLRVHTLQTPISLPYETSFENNLDNWIFKNEDLSNAFYIGNATSFDGNGCLYISNDYGVSNNYTTDVSNVTSYAYRMFYLEPGQYNVSYKWKAQGESTYDYGRAFIVPGDKLLNSGDEQFSYSGSPLNWIPIDNSYGLNLQSEWQSQSSNITIEKPGNYNVVFGWRNNDSRGYQTPLAIDSLAIDYLPCFSPVVMIDRIYDDKVFLRLYNNGDSVRIKVFSTEIPLDDISISTADILDTNVIGQYYEVNNLDESSEYYVYTKGYCYNGDSTNWTYSSFRTECRSILLSDNTMYRETFGSDTTMISCWTLNTNNEYVMYPQISATSYIDSCALYFYGTNSPWSTNYYSYAASPRIEGKSISDLQVRFKGYVTNTNYYILVGAMTDPNDVSTFIQLDSIMCSKTMSWEDIIVTFNNYSGDGQYIAFKTGPGANSQFYIDNVIIESSSNCVTPSKIYINNITDYSFEAQWDNHSSSSNWRVKVLQVDIQSDLMSDSCILDTVISNNSIIIDKLQIATSYSIIVQNQCSPNEISEWSNSVNVTTLCGSMIMPYFQDFEVFMPQCWSRYNGLLSTVVNAGGLVANSTAWSGVTNSDGLDGTHVRAGVWGANTNSWLVSPSINIDQSATLSFDIALYSTSSSVVYDKSDDRFIVIISTDNGLTWDVNNMTEWNNVGTGSYVMANISNSWKNYKINLSQYIGQNVKVAFYVESTIASGVDYLHLDNVLIDYVESTLLFDTVCQGYGYVDNQFNISPSEIQTAGKYVFNRTMLNSEQLDSIILLELTVIPTAYTFIDDTICHNNVYNGYGFLNINTTGVYTQTYYTVHGCDSIVSLNLKVRDEIYEINTHQICEKDIPYIWRTMELRESGVYSDTLLSVHDCDSIISLSLEIVPEYEHFDTVSVSFNELPFVYNDTIFDETTSIGDNNFIFHYLSNEGCDSIIHLQLTMLPIVRDNELYMNYIELYPNPISKDGILNVNANFSITELYEGLLLEVFNSVGERIKYQYIFNLPVQIKDFETSGLYIVRIKSKTNKSVYGKIIVQ